MVALAVLLWAWAQAAPHASGDPAPARAGSRQPVTAGLAVVVNLPASWRRVWPPSDQLMLTDGKYILVVKPLPADLSDEGVAKRLVEPKMRLGARQGNDWPVEAKAGPTSGWLTVRRCPEVHQTLLLTALVESRGKKAEAARALLGKARCRRPDEPPQSWPEAGKR
jgi:hypothetical protein